MKICSFVGIPVCDALVVINSKVNYFSKKPWYFVVRDRVVSSTDLTLSTWVHSNCFYSLLSLKIQKKMVQNKHQ